MKFVLDVGPVTPEDQRAAMWESLADPNPNTTPVLRPSGGAMETSFAVSGLTRPGIELTTTATSVSVCLKCQGKMALQVYKSRLWL